MSGWRIVADWGTTRLRLWRVVDGVAAQRLDGPGIGALAGAPADALRDAIGPWLAEHGRPTRITLCGMAGARNGLREVAYAECPASLSDWRAAAARFEFDGIALTLAAGCASEHDVMRGEETQVFGALAGDGGAARQVVVLPGTHSKWVWLDEGRIVGLRSFMTGELYALLQGSSLFATGAEPAEQDGGQGLAAGVALARQATGVMGSLFRARVEQLRRGRSAGWARGFLSGLLIGGEAAEMNAAGTLPGQVLVIGDGALASRYAEALKAFGVTADCRSGDLCALAGLELLDADD